MNVRTKVYETYTTYEGRVDNPHNDDVNIRHLTKGGIYLYVLAYTENKVRGESSGSYLIIRAMNGRDALILHYHSKTNKPNKQYMEGNVYSFEDFQMEGMSLLAKSIDEFDKSDLFDELTANVIIKEVKTKVKVPMYRDRIKVRYIFRAMYNESLIDRLYNWYSENIKHRDYEEEFIEESIIHDSKIMENE